MLTLSLDNLALPMHFTSVSLFILRQVDRINRPQAYSYEHFKENTPVCIKPTAEAELLPIPVLILAGIRAYTRNTVTKPTPLLAPSPLPLFHIKSSPVLILASPPNPILSLATIPSTSFKQIEAIEATEMRRLCVNDITGSMRTWVRGHTPPHPVLWKVTDIFTSPEALDIHNKIFDDN